MDFIKESLGRKISVKELASFLGVDVRTVKKYYLELGGIRLGERRFIFFEKEVIHAIQRQAEQKLSLGGAGETRGAEKEEVFSNQKGSSGVGKDLFCQQDGDRHGIFRKVG